MELFPMIPTQAVNTSVELPLCREAAWNFEMGKPLFHKGSPVIVTAKEAVKVWIWEALITQRKGFEIYSWSFGSDVESLIGQNYTSQTKEAEAKRYIREALEINPYIKEVGEITVSFAGNTLRIQASVETIYGGVEVRVDV